MKLRKAIARVVGWDADDPNFQDYIVANLYPGPGKHIGEHTDCNNLWGDVDGENVILSYAVTGSGVFVCRPVKASGEIKRTNLYDHLCSRFNTTKNFLGKVLERRLGTAVYQPPNSLLVMGGFFQSQMMHGTVSHSWVRPLGL